MRRVSTSLLATASLLTSGWYLTGQWRQRQTLQEVYCNTLSINESNNESLNNDSPDELEKKEKREEERKSDINKKGKSLDSYCTQCNNIINQTIAHKGLPGLSVTVTVNGTLIYSQGFGLADVENNVPCTPNTLYRIASISKPITATAIMQLVDEGKIDLDAPIHEYLPDYPKKSYQGVPVVMTTRQFLSHTSGTRHYHGNDERGRDSEINSCHEYYIKDHYDSVSESLKLFSEDPLVAMPGTQYHYTTFGYSVISAIIEAVSGEKFLDYLKKNIFSPMSMNCTGPDLHIPLLKCRARYYVRNSKGILENTPYVDSSYKWAGGGLLSTSNDLIKFGNSLLVHYQLNEEERNIDQVNDHLISPKSIKDMWNIQVVIKPEEKGRGQVGYGLGWKITERKDSVISGCGHPMIVEHSGSAVGVSSILTVIPHDDHVPVTNVSPRGVVVAIITNLQDVNLSSLGQQIGLMAYKRFLGNRKHCHDNHYRDNEKSKEKFKRQFVSC